MKKLKLGKAETLGYDVEHKTMPVLYIKGIGRKCIVCSRHITGRKDKVTCSNKCNVRVWRIKNEGKCDDKSSIRARVSIKKSEGIEEYRVLSLYLKKGISRKIKITSAHGELWHVLEMVEKYRRDPMVIKA